MATKRPAGDPTGTTRSGCHRQALEQKLDERLFHVRLGVACHVQGYLVEVDALAHLLGQGGLEGGRVGGERRRGAAKGMDHENTLGGPILGSLGTSDYDQENNGAQCIYA